MLTFSREWAILTLETGALPANGQSPYSVTEVTACLGAGRLLLFVEHFVELWYITSGVARTAGG